MSEKIPKDILKKLAKVSPDERLDSTERKNTTIEVIDDPVSIKTTKFEKKEVIEFIKALAEEEGVDPDSLEVTMEIYNKQGVLTYLEMVYRGDVFSAPLKAFFHNVLYGFDLRSPRRSVQTMISRVYNFDDQKTSRGGILGRFNETTHTWLWKPGSILPNATDSDTH